MSGGKARAASTGFRRIGVVKRKAAGIEPIVVIYGCTHQVHAVALIYVDRDAIQVKALVVLALFVESKHVAHAGATTTFDANTESISFGDVLCGHDLLNFLSSLGAQLNGCFGGGNLSHTTSV